MSDGKETLGAPLLGARTANPRLFTGARARDLEEGTGDDDDATTTTTTTMTSSARRYAHRRDMFMSGRDRDLEDAQQAEARDQLSDWAQMLRSLSRTRRGTEAADAATAEASRHALKTATRAGFHRARVDLYEGSNLDTPENEQTRRTAEARSSMGRAATIALRWVLVVLIVLAAVLVAFGIHECSRWGQHATRLATELAYNKSGKKSWAAIATFTGVGTLFAAAAGLIMWRVNPTLKGGVNEVLCYLNGIVVNHSFGPNQFLTQVLGLALVTASPMAVGREGPMLAIGGQIGAGVGSLATRSVVNEFEMRNMVAVGLGTGIACAFGAPIGAVIFALEKGFHFTMRLMRRLFVASMLTCFCFSFVLTAVDDGHFGSLSLESLCHFGELSSTELSIKQLPVFLVMGVVGGVVGALFNFLNLLVTRFRRSFIKRPGARFVEVVCIAAVTAFLWSCLATHHAVCVPMSANHTEQVVTLGCGAGQHNVVATLTMTSHENVMHFLFHEPSALSPLVLLTFLSLFFVAAFTSLGTAVPAGFFLPSMLTGALIGRIIAESAGSALEETFGLQPGLLAFVGAGAVLGGVCRMPVSLTIIMCEATNQASYTLYLMMAMIVAKGVGDLFIPSITAIGFKLSQYPILQWDTPSVFKTHRAKEIMNTPVVVLRRHESLRHIVTVLQTTSHNGFPVVEDEDRSHRRPGSSTSGPLLGIVLRSQLEEHIVADPQLRMLCDALVKDIRDTRSPEPAGTEFGVVAINGDGAAPACSADARCVDLSTLFNHCITVHEDVSCSRVFKLFRQIGLRHVVVVDPHNNVPIGMITRKDLFFLHNDLKDNKPVRRSCWARFQAMLYGVEV